MIRLRPITTLHTQLLPYPTIVRYLQTVVTALILYLGIFLSTSSCKKKWDIMNMKKGLISVTKCKMISGNHSIIKEAEAFINFRALTSFGLSNEWDHQESEASHFGSIQCCILTLIASIWASLHFLWQATSSPIAHDEHIYHPNFFDHVQVLVQPDEETPVFHLSAVETNWIQ